MKKLVMCTQRLMQRENVIEPGMCPGCNQKSTFYLRGVWDQELDTHFWRCSDCCKSLGVLTECWDWDDRYARLLVRPSEQWMEALAQAASSSDFLNNLLGAFNQYRCLTEKQFVAGNKVLLAKGIRVHPKRDESTALIFN